MPCMSTKFGADSSSNFFFYSADTQTDTVTDATDYPLIPSLYALPTPGVDRPNNIT